MKKALIVLGIILVVVGIIVVAACGGFAGLKAVNNLFKHDLSTADTSKTVELNGVAPSKLEITTSAYSVYLRPSSEDILAVKYVGDLPQGVSIDVGTTDNGAYIRETDNIKSLSWFGSLFTHSDVAKHFLLVEVPHGLLDETNITVTIKAGKFNAQSLNLGNLNCTVNAGNIEISDGSLNQLSLTDDAGTVSLENVSLQKLTVKIDAGTLNADGVSCGVADLTVKAGTVNMSDCTVSGNLSVIVDAGTINCKATADSVKLHDDAGTVNFEIKSENIDVEVDVGTVHGKVLGNSADYNIVVIKDVGASNISTNNNTDANCKLTVRVDTGSISVNFNN